MEEAPYAGRNAQEASEIVAPIAAIMIDCNDGYLAVQIESWDLSHPGGMNSCLRHLLFLSSGRTGCSLTALERSQCILAQMRVFDFMTRSVMITM